LTWEKTLAYALEVVMPDWTSAKIKTLILAALFLLLAASRPVGSNDSSAWVYEEYKSPEGQTFNVKATVHSKPYRVRSFIEFSFQTRTQCEPKLVLTSFAFPGGYGKYQSSAPLPEEWAAQVDENSPEQGPAVDNLYMNALEIFLPVSRSLVSDAESGRLLRMWQTATGGVEPPPAASRTRVEVSLRGAAGPLQRAEARCDEALRR